MATPIIDQPPIDTAARPRRGEALVVYESMFGNTADVATAISSGLALEGLMVTTVEASTAPDLADVDVDLLVLGSPTHAFSLSRPSTRLEAVRQGAPAERARVGLREWLRAGTAPAAGTGTLAATFDTRASKVRFLPKSAATGSAHLLKRLGFTLLMSPEGFVVSEVSGPLLPGEADRAAAGGRDLATAYALQCSR